MGDFSQREMYLLAALRVIASFGRDERTLLRPYMRAHNIAWNEKEDVKLCMRRIAEDAIEYAHKN